MSYWQFLILFLALPMVGLLVLCWRWLTRRFWLYLILLIIIALIFTIPMDNYAINQGIWKFNPEKIWQIHLFTIPLEEYFFYLLWIMDTSLLALFCWHRLGPAMAQREDDPDE